MKKTASKIITALALAAPLLWHAPANATGDAGLYDAPLPDGAAFVRLICAKESQLTFAVGQSTLGKCSGPEVKSYKVVLYGNYQARAGAEQFGVNVEAGKYYSLALRPGGKLSWYEDNVSPDVTKASLHFYNVSAAPSASLVVPAHGVDVFKDITAEAAAARTMNALSVALAVNVDGKQVAESASHAFSRGQATAIAFVGSGTADDAYRLLVKDHEIER